MFQRLFSIEVVQSVLIHKKNSQLSCKTYYFQTRHTVKVLNINTKCQFMQRFGHSELLYKTNAGIFTEKIPLKTC